MNGDTKRPPDRPWLTPYLMVRDVDAAMTFYRRAFGFEPGFTLPAGEDTVHGEMRYEGETVVMLGREAASGSPASTPASTETPAPIGLYVYCADVDALHGRAADAGAAVLSPPTDMFWGDRVVRLRDPDGHQWSFATWHGNDA